MERLGALGVRDVEPGQVYRALRALERERCLASVWVTSPAGPARRRYQLTPEGLASLSGWAVRLGRLHETVGSCLARLAQAQGDAPAMTATDPPAKRATQGPISPGRSRDVQAVAGLALPSPPAPIRRPAAARRGGAGSAPARRASAVTSARP